MACKKCGNRLGFVFGTCVQCGYNETNDTYDHIKVYISDLGDLPAEFVQRLIDRHDKNVTRFN